MMSARGGRQPDGVIATEKRRDSLRLLDEDNFQIILDTFHDRRLGYMFVTKPAGRETRATGRRGRRRRFPRQQLEHQPELGRGLGRRDPPHYEGWVAEIAIPGCIAHERDQRDDGRRYFPDRSPSVCSSRTRTAGTSWWGWSPTCGTRDSTASPRRRRICRYARARSPRWRWWRAPSATRWRLRAPSNVRSGRWMRHSQSTT